MFFYSAHDTEVDDGQEHKVTLGQKELTVKQKELSDYEIKFLQKCFTNNRQPDAEDLEEIAEDINLELATVQDWFVQKGKLQKVAVLWQLQELENDPQQILVKPRSRHLIIIIIILFIERFFWRCQLKALYINKYTVKHYTEGT